MIDNNINVTISILFPIVYNEILSSQIQTLNCTTTITKKPFSDCQLFGRELLIKDTSAYIRSQNYMTYVSQVLNPNHYSHCLEGVPPLQNKFFIKVFDSNSDEVIAASSYVDLQKCLLFK